MQGSKKLGTDILKNPSICNYDQPNKYIKEDYCNGNDTMRANILFISLLVLIKLFVWFK